MRHISLLVALAVAALAVTAGIATAKVPTGPSGLSFYKPPAHLSGKHGSVIWVRKASSRGALKPAAYTALVLYRSRADNGSTIAVSGSITVPKGKAPRGGWPILTWAHGTTGIADICAPTRIPTAPLVSYVNSSLDAWLKAGFAVVRTDYQGLGTPGTHEYLVGQDEGHSVLDIVRAARQVDSTLGKKVIIGGHSQGGHAALWAAAEAPKVIPELDLLGTVAEAPASHIEQQANLIGALNTPSPGLSAEASLIFRGVDVAQPSLNLVSLLSPAAAALYPQTLTRCLGDLSKTDSLGGLTPAQLLRDGTDRTALFAVLGKNDPQHLRIKTPLFMAQGTADTTVIPTFTDQLDQELTAKGTKIDYRHYQGVTHGGVVPAANRDALAWARKLLK
jgi:pimeloyl-ACP methyl ester carboxylesterase